MEWISKINEKIETNAIIVEDLDIEHAIHLSSRHTRKIPKIPTVLRLDKKYDCFNIKITDQMENTNFDKYNILILVNNNFETSELRMVKLILTLNAKYYSHSEILKKLIGIDFNCSAYEVVGNIIHLNLTEEQIKYKQLIAEVLFYKTGYTVINKIGKIDNVYRTYENEILMGNDNLICIHKENEIKFKFDLSEVYWCSRLQSERLRILNMIKKNDVVCDPFCGVGPHILPAIKMDALAYCNDLNPNAVKWLKISLDINKIECKNVYNMDAVDFLMLMKDKKIDHLIINLPELSLNYLRYAFLFKDFWIHCFFFCRVGDDPINEIFNKTGLVVESSWIRECRKVSPTKSVIKLEVYSLEFFQKNECYREDRVIAQ